MSNLIETPIKSLIQSQTNLITEIFNLIYYGKLNYSDLVVMPVHERKKITELLIETKKRENAK